MIMKMKEFNQLMPIPGQYRESEITGISNESRTGGFCDRGREGE
jgi:hypothetical protein